MGCISVNGQSTCGVGGEGVDSPQYPVHVLPSHCDPNNHCNDITISIAWGFRPNNMIASSIPLHMQDFTFPADKYDVYFEHISDLQECLYFNQKETETGRCSYSILTEIKNPTLRDISFRLIKSEKSLHNPLWRPGPTLSRRGCYESVSSPEKLPMGRIHSRMGSTHRTSEQL